MNELIEPTDDSPDAIPGLNHVSLARKQHEPVSRLPGFKRTHRIPMEVSEHTQAFVGRLAAERVRSDLDDVFDQLRSVFRFKRSEIESTEHACGHGEIATPYFLYQSAVVLNPRKASEAIWRRDISRIANLNQLLTDEFASVFGGLFDTVEFSPPSPIDITSVIDRVEARDDPRVSLNYNRQLSFCEIAIAGTNVKIHVTSEAFRIVHPDTETPRVLLQSLSQVQQAIVGFSTIRL
jgi:hypothetical protein